MVIKRNRLDFVLGFYMIQCVYKHEIDWSYGIKIQIISIVLHNYHNNRTIVNNDHKWHWNGLSKIGPHCISVLDLSGELIQYYCIPNTNIFSCIKLFLNERNYLFLTNPTFYWTWLFDLNAVWIVHSNIAFSCFQLWNLRYLKIYKKKELHFVLYYTI